MRRTRKPTLLAPLLLLGCTAATLDREPPLDPRLGEDPDAIVQTQPERLGLTVEMNNSLGGFARSYQQSPGAVRWSPWEGYCCEQGNHTRSCLTVDQAGLDDCRDRGRLALTCKRLEDCTGPECFCCSHGFESVCSAGDVPEEEAPALPPVRRKTAPSVWSPE